MRKAVTINGDETTLNNQPAPVLDEFEPSEIEREDALAKNYMYGGGNCLSIKDFCYLNEIKQKNFWVAIRRLIAKEAAEERGKTPMQRDLEILEDNLKWAHEHARQTKKIYDKYPDDPLAKQMYSDARREISELRDKLGKMMGV